MSFFQDIVKTAQSVIGPKDSDPAAATPQKIEEQQKAADMNTDPAHAGKKAEKGSMLDLFGHLADSVTMGFGDFRKAEADAEEETRRRKRRDSMKDNDIRTEAENQFNNDPKNKNQRFSITQDEIERRKAGKMLGGDYKTKNEIDADKNTFIQYESDKPVGKLDTPEERMKFLNGFTQNNVSLEQNGTDISKHACAPTSVIAAAIAMDGPKGLTPIIERMEKDLQSKPPAERKLEQMRYNLMKERIEKGEMNMTDMVNLQKDLYDSMHNQQNADRKKSNDKTKDDGSISVDTVKSYLSSVETVKDKDHPQNMMQRMKANGLEIRGIDNDGDGRPNHAILDMQGEIAGGPNARAVYDPYSRYNGQLVKSPEQLKDYYGTTHVGTQPKPFSLLDML